MPDTWRAHRVGTCQIHGGHMIDTGLEHARYMDNSEYMVDT